jgi:hypothetical protein
MQNGISLQLINNSNEPNSITVLIFQKNNSTEYDLAVAWRVIWHLAQGNRYPFVFSDDLLVSASDSWGNFTPQFAVRPGQAYEMVRAESGDVLKPYPQGASNPEEIDVLNGLGQGAINASIYRSGELLAAKTDIVPGQKASFAFEPTIFLGVVSEMLPGQIIRPSILPELSEISLLGIQSADIVITGGVSAPYKFTLENVVQA